MGIAIRPVKWAANTPIGATALMTSDHAAAEDIFFGIDASMRGNGFEFLQEWLLERLLRPGDTAVDAGANVGGHTQGMLLSVGAKGRVVAIEPSPHLHAHLEPWTKLWPNLTLCETALSNMAGELDFFVPVGDQGYGSLWQRDTQFVEVAERVRVRTERLDDLLDRLVIGPVRVLKMDVEGAEMLAIEGAERTLRTRRPVVMVEVDWGLSTAARAGPDATPDIPAENWATLKSLVDRVGYEAFTLFGDRLTGPAPHHTVVLLAPADMEIGPVLRREAPEMAQSFAAVAGLWTVTEKFVEGSPFYGRLARVTAQAGDGGWHRATLQARLKIYLAALPLLHSWDGGATWNTGGFEAHHLNSLACFLLDGIGPGAHILETGAGNSTITFLQLEPARVASICPEPDLFDRIEQYCRSHDIDLGPAEFIDGVSEWELPRLAQLGLAPPQFDFVLIDGHHGWPHVFVDFFYGNFLLKTDGFVMIDDVQLHSVQELMRLLDRQPGFVRVLDLGKSVVYRRDVGERVLPEWVHQPYIVERSA